MTKPKQQKEKEKPVKLSEFDRLIKKALEYDPKKKK